MIECRPQRRTPVASATASPRDRRSLDLLRVPWLGRFFRWRWSRTIVQLPLLLVSAIMIVHAFWGPQWAAKNLATLLTWVHFRGLVVVVILLAGNLFCMACPFMLVRDLARRLHAPRWNWPRWLRNKWPAIALFVAVLFAYELFDFWSDPRSTGLLIVGYFAAAVTIDLFFRGASFCKFVCPVGQFNFASATMAPLEVAVREPDVCQQCRTKDCIRGRREPEKNSPTDIRPSQLPIIQRGCELALFQPRKVGNLDCTFCLDCVYACPHDNIGLLARVPAEELTVEGTRSGIGHLEKRFDFTALAVVFTFGAILNAFAMISPVYAAEQWLARWSGLNTEWPLLATLFLAALVLEPAILLTAAAWLTRGMTRTELPLLAIVNRFAKSLLPIGFGIWLAHYGFHFFTGFLTIIPVTQNAVSQWFGAPWLGQPSWQLGGLPEAAVFPMEIGFLSLGLIGSWLVTWSIAREFSPRNPWSGFLPWGVLQALLFVTAVWIMLQPMDMRGTFLGA